MPVVYMLINTDVTKEEDVITQLKEIPEVKSADLVYGVYDIVVKIKTDDHNQLKEVTTQTLRHIKHIRDTITIVADDSD